MTSICFSPPRLTKLSPKKHRSGDLHDTHSYGSGISIPRIGSCRSRKELRSLRFGCAGVVGMISAMPNRDDGATSRKNKKCTSPWVWVKIKAIN